MFQVQVDKNKAWVTERETLTLYCQGCDPVKVGLSFSSEWNGLSKIAVFRAYDRQIDLAFTDSEIEIPVNALLKPDVHLLLGIYGINSTGTVVISTIWTDLGIIQPGPNPTAAENYSLPPENIYQQVYELAEAAEAAASQAISGNYSGTLTFTIDNSTGVLSVSRTINGVTTSADIGGVTAYAAALDAGYTGSYDLFKELLLANGRTAYEVDQALALVNALAASVATARTESAGAANTANNASATATAAQSAAAAAQATAGEKQKQHIARTVSLAANASSWEGISCQGVTENNLVFWGPAPASLDAAANANVKLTAQAANSLTFVADRTTTEEITINVAIFD